MLLLTTVRIVITPKEGNPIIYDGTQLEFSESYGGDGNRKYGLFRARNGPTESDTTIQIDTHTRDLDKSL